VLEFSIFDYEKDDEDDCDCCSAVLEEMRPISSGTSAYGRSLEW